MRLMQIMLMWLCIVGFGVNAGLADQAVIPDYDTARDDFVYDQVYPSGGRTIYCDRPFTSRAGLQVEYVLPASWMKEAAGCEGTLVSLAAAPANAST